MNIVVQFFCNKVFSIIYNFGHSNNAQQLFYIINNHVDLSLELPKPYSDRLKTSNSLNPSSIKD